MAKSKPGNKPLSDMEIVALLKNRISTAVNYTTDTFTRHRIEAEEFYRGEAKTLPSAPGRSKVISREFAEVVDVMMASLMRVFASMDEPIRFEPRRQQDILLAEVVTKYVNNVLMNMNDGFKLMHDWFKAALMFRIGTVKVWWDERIDVKEYDYENLDEYGYQALLSDPDVDIVETTVKTDPDALQLAENHVKYVMTMMLANGQQPTPDMLNIDEDQLPKKYDVKIRKRRKLGETKCMVVPSEEVLFTEYKVSQEDRELIGHRRLMTRSEILEMGYDPDLVETIPFGTTNDFLRQETWQRHQPETPMPYTDSVNDRSRDQTFVTEIYDYIDVDGDGLAELRKITVAGENDMVILDNEIVDDHPFCVLSPVLSPFKMVGLSLYDQTRDLQQIKSTAMRQMLDNFYLATHNRLAINAKTVNMDDVLNPRPGQPIRCENPGQDIVPLNVPTIADTALEVLQYCDQTREARTGVTRFNAGLDSDALNINTATMANMVSNAGNQRMELIARNFAETGVKRLAKLIFNLEKKHNDSGRVMRYGGAYVPINPITWDGEFDLVAQVGLGKGNRDQQLNRLLQIAPIMAQVIQFQDSTGKKMIDAKQVYNYMSDLFMAAGQAEPNQYISDPDTLPQQPPPQPQPDPSVQVAQINARVKAQELALNDRHFEAKHQVELMQAQAKFTLQRQDQQNDLLTHKDKMDLETAKLATGTRNAAADRAVDMLQMQHDAENAKLDRQMEAAGMAVDTVNQAADRMHEANLMNSQMQNQNQADAVDHAMNAINMANENMHRNADRAAQAQQAQIAAQAAKSQKPKSKK